MSRISRCVLVVLTAMLLVSCATGRAIRRAQDAVRQGDYDSAVVYYRQALASEPTRVDLRIQLERMTRMASAEHMRRARELEAQEQLAGAMAEYRLAAELDTTNTLANSKAIELERRLRDMADAARRPPRIENARQQAAQTSPIPRLDPRTRVPLMRYPNVAVRDLLRTVSDLTGINITYDVGLDATLSRPYSLDVQDVPVEDVLNQILQGNGLTFKVSSPQSIFVYQDTPTKRQQFEDQYTQTFYISNADPAEIQQILNQVLAQGPAVRPVIVPNRAANSLVVRATAPVMAVIENIIRQNDRPRPQVLIEAEILEVDRTFIRQLGLDLNQFALGFTFSPELAPPNTASVPGAFPSGPPPFNLNTLREGVSPADFYLTSPTALIRLLESNTQTKVLAKPQLMGRDGTPMTLLLGDSVPIPQTTFSSAAAGGVANIPTTSVTYQPVGVNLLFTPRVTYQDEIILDGLTLEKSGLGNNVLVGGQSFPTIVTRRAGGSLRLRDGESNLIAGLLRDDDRKTLRSFPGLTGIPVLRSLFGSSDTEATQTDIVMIITPHIIRGHDITPDDLRPQYVGTGTNFGASATPPLISPEALGVEPAAPAGGVPAPQGVPQNVNPPAPATPAAPAAPSPAAPRAPGVVPVVPVPTPSPTSSNAPATAPGSPRVAVTAPTSVEGTLQSGGGPYTIPITITDAPEIQALSLTITYNPAVLRSPTVTQGSFMMQTGASPTFVPKVDADDGRIDLVLSRPPGQGGASRSGLVAAIAFTAGYPGLTDISVTGVATGVDGKTVSLEFAPTQVVVR